MPNGDVAGCVMSGAMMTAGNIHSTPLASIIDSQAWRDIAARVPQPRRAACVPDTCTPRQDSCEPSPGADSWMEFPQTVCTPDVCSPQEDNCGPSTDNGADPWVESRATACNPDSDGDDCSPAESDACGPSY
jgi:hypothetical protein